MTNQDKIKEIKDALDKITPGEWTASRTFSPTWAVHLGDRKLVLLGRAGLSGSMAGEIRGDLNESDATFIANSPEWVRFLLSEIDRLQQDRDEARRKAEEAWNENDAIERAYHKLIEGLREIDTHIRSTPEPVQHIVETLKRVLPEYQEGVTVE